MIKHPQPISFRHELKYRLTPAEDLLLASRLRRLFVHDPHGDARGIYRVSSLYFDTPTDTALRRKVSGVDNREKFRLRCYNGDPETIRLEKKIRKGTLCAKRSAVLTARQAEQLLAGEVDFLLAGENPLLQEFYSKIRGQQLMPKTVVTYDREAFLFAPGNVRVTIDRSLRTGIKSTDFLNPELPQVQASEGMPVLEVKYDNYLPEIVSMAVQIGSGHAVSCSKYAICRRYD